ncbi:MAG: hypothetical protein ACYTBP_06295 [Planctomycetota bacterium]|jgi:hypothetical protein
MKLEGLQNKKEIISTTLLLFSIAAGLVIFVRAADFLVSSVRAAKIITEASNQGKYDPNDMGKYLSRSKERAEELKKKNLFVPPQKKKHPVNKVTAIMGDEAYINGKWYKAGAKVGDANIVEIEATYVKIVWQGKEKKFAPFDVKTPAAPEKKEKPKVKAKPKEMKVEKKTVEKVVEVVVEEDPLAWMGVKLSAKLRAILLEKWNEMSDEQKQQWKDKWNSMTDEQKEQTVEQMEQNVDKM